MNIPNDMPELDSNKLLSRLTELGNIGREKDNKLIRLAITDSDKLGRDKFITWLNEAGLDVVIDRIGNIFGIWQVESEIAPLMMGSHIDTIINAGIYDGCYGVLTGLSVIECCRNANVNPDRSLIVAAFTNEEGVRYAPDMMGSLVYAGGLDTDKALATVGTDGSVLGDELTRIGYAGDMQPGEIIPSVFLEVHIEQGPVLEVEGKLIGAVANLQGISWQKLTISGVANHAGTTPTRLRKDAGLAAAKVITFLREYVGESDTVATVGTIRFEPNAINVIPAKAAFTVDLRDPNEHVLSTAEEALDSYVESLRVNDGVEVTKERLARFDPVIFDEAIVQLIEKGAEKLGLSYRRMTSGAGHDAQMMSRICPTAMIFVPSKDGVSHNPLEFTDDESLIAGANVMLNTVLSLTTQR